MSDGKLSTSEKLEECYVTLSKKKVLTQVIIIARA